MKIKIRKIEVDTKQFLKEIERIVLVDEKIPAQAGYLGTNIKTVLQGLGIKENDFWEIAQNDKTAFKEAFAFFKESFIKGNFLIFRRPVWEKGYATNLEELDW